MRDPACGRTQAAARAAAKRKEEEVGQGRGVGDAKGR